MASRRGPGAGCQFTGPGNRAEELSRSSEHESEALLRDLEPDPVLRRRAARVAVHNTYQMIIAWLEHGDPARDADVLDRIRESNRAAVLGGRGRRRTGSRRGAGR